MRVVRGRIDGAEPGGRNSGRAQASGAATLGRRMQARYRAIFEQSHAPGRPAGVYDPKIIKLAAIFEQSHAPGRPAGDCASASPAAGRPAGLPLAHCAVPWRGRARRLPGAGGVAPRRLRRDVARRDMLLPRTGSRPRAFGERDRNMAAAVAEASTGFPRPGNHGKGIHGADPRAVASAVQMPAGPLPEPGPAAVVAEESGRPDRPARIPTLRGSAASPASAWPICSGARAPAHDRPARRRAGRGPLRNREDGRLAEGHAPPRPDLWLARRRCRRCRCRPSRPACGPASTRQACRARP